ncbi:ATP-binding protein [Deinococcus koreensis]|uniref:Bacterial transcriptional activator domain-containing protein n=1 Tax=Deinococcus koreensis TaxID=2054903 RepID=A0A2K3UZG7_9DEIO|nr:BTAD domain-containing putative transcriptional regulator [Deinococcus koreensis]PNY81938.1 hypothetical protein CVO96_11665 [Deinococcus koreensis]
MTPLPWHYALLGPPELSGPEGQRLRLERKAAALLAYLALEGPTHRARLAGLLWPETREASARNNLVQLLRKLRLALGRELVQGAELLGLSPGLETDALQARDAFTRGQYAELAAFGGELLAGFSYDDCPDLEDWLLAERERWREWRATAAREESARLEREGDYGGALERARALLDLDPLSEEAWRRLMRLLYLRGDRPAALDAYRRCEALLRREFGVEPLPETRALLLDIERGVVEVPARPGPPGVIPLATLRPPALVGREREWARMEEAWRAGQVIFLCGEPGSGKSRLARDFAASKGEVLFLEGRPGDLEQPYATAARNLRAHLARCPDVTLESWERRELARILPELAGPEPETAPLLSEADTLRFKQATLNLVRRTCEGLAAMVTDDMQYFDPASSDFGAFMMSAAFPLGQPGGLPHFIDTYRRGELAPEVEQSLGQLVAAGIAVVIDLPPLQGGAVDDLLDHLGVPGSPELRGGLQRYAGGNPLFLLETVRHLIETGQLERGLPPGLPPPGRVGPLLARRLERLSSPALQAARAAAVLQSDFDLELVAGVLHAPLLELLGAWEELEAAQIIHGNRFSHDLVYEAVREGTSASVRQLLHRAAARTLAERGGHAARVGQHWLQGGDFRQAAPWLLRAAQAAFSTLRLLEAAEFYRQAAEAWQRADDPAAAFSAWAARAEALGHLDDRAARQGALDELFAHARTPLERARAWQLQAELHIAFAEAAETRQAAAQGLAALSETFQDTPAVREQRANLEACAGSALWLQGQMPEAAQALRRAVTALSALGESQSLAANLSNLAAVLDHLEEHAEATGLHRRACELFERSGHLPELSATLYNLSVSLLDQGQARAALHAAQRAHEIESRTDGDPGNAALGHANLGQAYASLGHYGQALRHLSLARAAARPDSWHAGYLPTLAAEVWLALGQVDRAAADLATAQDWPGVPGAYRSRTLVAHGLLAARRGEDPGEVLSEAEELLGVQPRPLAQARVWLASALTAPPEEGLALARGVCTVARTRGLGGMETAAHVRAAQALLALRRPAEALPHARAAQHLLQTLEAVVLSRGEALFTVARALALADEPDAAQALADARGWIAATAEAHVPAEFRSSFLNRFPETQWLDHARS